MDIDQLSRADFYQGRNLDDNRKADVDKAALPDKGQRVGDNFDLGADLNDL